MAQHAYYEFFRQMPDLAAATNQLEIRLRREGHGLAADKLLRAYVRFEAELQKMAVNVSVLATNIVKESERKTRVRPDTGGHGGPRLEDHLYAEPFEPTALPGSVGVANETDLDKSVPWWSTNEEGGSGRVGGKLFGTFFGGGSDSPPSGGEFRQHALFEPGKGPNAGSGIIKRPIPARRFILKAIPEIDRVWHAEFNQIKARFDGELAQVIEMARTGAVR